jgi:ParB family chromosome partitioning protein
LVGSKRKPEIRSLDDLFGIPAASATEIPKDAAFMETVVLLPIAKIRDFANHPYRVQNDRITQDIVQDIQETGHIETPAIVRPVGGGYEMISGHRRKLACLVAGLGAMPVIIRQMTDDEATVAMVSANRQREEVLPSEKAFAYKMWLDAIKRQAGRPRQDNYSPVGNNSLAKTSSAELAETIGESKNQIFRHIRLTELIPELLEMVDNMVLRDKDRPQIAMRPAVELSYLPAEQQDAVLYAIESESCTPSHVQAMKMRKFSEEGRLGADVILSILQEEKPNQKELLRLPKDKINQFFKPGTPAQKIEADIISGLKLLQRQRQRSERSAR